MTKYFYIKQLKLRRKLTEYWDLCFIDLKYIKSPITVFHDIIGFVDISESNLNKLETHIEKAKIRIRGIK